MGLWEDANLQLDAKRAATDAHVKSRTDLVATQQQELREFLDAVQRLGIAPEKYELRGWLHRLGPDSNNVRSGQTVSGWAIDSWRGQSTRTDFQTPDDTTYYLVLTADLKVYNTENQHVEHGFLRKKWTIKPRELPIAGAQDTESKLSSVLRPALVKYIERSR